MAKNYIPVLFLFFGVCAQSQVTQGIPPPNGCNIYAAIDSDNDGFATFDVTWLTSVYFPGFLSQFGYDLSGYQIELQDYISGELIPGPMHVNASAMQFTSARLTYIGPGPNYDEDPNFLAANPCMVLTPLPSDGDFDSDGIPNIDEDANGNGTSTTTIQMAIGLGIFRKTI
jgi:hypothetical protein